MNDKKCSCPEKRREEIRRDDRVYVIGPKADVVNGANRTINMDHIEIYHKDCPVHGYKVIEDEH